MTEPIQSLRLAYAYTRAAVPLRVRVETMLTGDAAMTTPLVVVSATPPVSANNGPHHSAARFTVSLSCYDVDSEKALDLCQEVVAGFYRLWNEGHVTPYGWISNISRDSLQPVMTLSNLKADGYARFNAAIQVIARQ